MPEIADGILSVMCHQLNGLDARIDGLTKLIEQHAWLDADARRLIRIPGIGPITASAIVATIGDPSQFKTARDLAAWLRLAPLNKSSGGRERLGRITEKGGRYIRKRLIIGMTSRAHGQELPRESRRLDCEASRRKALPAGDGRHGQQIRPDHLGATSKAEKIPAVDRLILPRDTRRLM